jgi:hypothetical protein
MVAVSNRHAPPTLKPDRETCPAFSCFGRMLVIGDLPLERLASLAKWSTQAAASSVSELSNDPQNPLKIQQLLRPSVAHCENYARN